MADEPTADGRKVWVISDASGATAERVVRVTLAQFGNTQVEVEVVPHIRHVAEIRRIVRDAARRRGLIAYTLVSPRLRGEIAAHANEAGVATVDLMGPVLTALSAFLSAAPAYRPGLFRQADAEQYQRLEAVAFTVQHDDGLRLSDLAHADLVITGPSRVSKTPLSVYLAHTRGLRVANVPLALGVEPFDELLDLPPGRIAGLTINAHLLSRIRQVRQNELGAGDIEYAQIPFVQRELRYCHEIYRRPGWPVVDITGKSIEEIASEVCAVTVDAPPAST